MAGQYTIDKLEQARSYRGANFCEKLQKRKRRNSVVTPSHYIQCVDLVRQTELSNSMFLQERDEEEKEKRRGGERGERPGRVHALEAQKMRRDPKNKTQEISPQNSMTALGYFPEHSTITGDHST